MAASAALPKPMAKILVEAARASALAAHSAAGLAREAGPGGREAMRLLRSAEALSRAAVVCLQRPAAPVPAAIATVATGDVAGPSKAKRRRQRKRRQPKGGTTAELARALPPEVGGGDLGPRWMAVDGVGGVPSAKPPLVESPSAPTTTCSSAPTGPTPPRAEEAVLSKETQKELQPEEQGEPRKCSECGRPAPVGLQHGRLWTCRRCWVDLMGDECDVWGGDVGAAPLPCRGRASGPCQVGHAPSTAPIPKRGRG